MNSLDDDIQLAIHVLVAALVISVPLAAWKLVDIVVWMVGS